MNYLAFALLNKVVAHIAQGLCNEPLIEASANTNRITINLEAVTLANTVLQAVLETLRNIISGAEAMEVCLLYYNSVFHRRALVMTTKTITIDEGNNDQVRGTRVCRKALPINKDEAFATPLKKVSMVKM